MLKHDNETGLMFEEKTAPAAKISVFRWLNANRGSDKTVQEFCHPGPGADLLMSMATRSILMNRSGLDAKILENVEWDPVGKLIWKNLVKAQLDTVQLWKEFVTRYDEDFRLADFTNVRHYLAPSIPPVILLPTLEFFAHRHFAFVTTLHLCDVALPIAEWVNLSRWIHLRVLALNSSRNSVALSPALTDFRYNIDDRIIRAWSLQSLEKPAFPQLEALLLHGQVDMTSQGQVYLADMGFEGPYKRPKPKHQQNPKLDRPTRKTDMKALLNELSCYSGERAEKPTLQLSAGHDRGLAAKFVEYERFLRKPGLLVTKRGRTETGFAEESGESNGKKAKLRESQQKDIGQLLADLAG